MRSSSRRTDMMGARLYVAIFTLCLAAFLVGFVSSLPESDILVKSYSERGNCGQAN
jgi:hypothetical protein